jgi:MFS family permease
MNSISKRDSPHSSAGLLQAKPWQVAMIGLGTAAAQLDTSVNIAFPAITRAFDVSIGDIQWVVICYVLTYASLLLALGRIGDTVGHALVFRIGLIWSTNSAQARQISIFTCGALAVFCLAPTVP